MDTTTVGRLLIVVGVAVAIVGGFLALGGRLPFGRLPGDISVQGQNGGGFFFPVVTCLVLSIVLTVVLNIVIRR
jgi:hypothetical protein